MAKTNLLKIYQNSFRDNWSLPALSQYGRGEVLTYGDFAKQIAQTHILFRECGVKKGDKVAVMGKNTVSWIVSYMATLTYGAVVVPVLAEFNPIDATHIINHSGSKLLFVAESIWEHMDMESMPQLLAAISLDEKVVLAEHSSNKQRAEKALKDIEGHFRRSYPNGFRPADVVYPDIDKGALAEINYTSGTTGFSKGVMLTLNNLAGNVQYGVDSHLHFPGSRCLAFLPLAHAYGAAFDMLTPLAAGGHVAALDKLPSPSLLVKALNQIKPNLIICVPLILEKIYKKHLMPLLERKTVKYLMGTPLVERIVYARIRRKLIKTFGGEFSQVIVGGAPLNAEVEQFLHRIKFPFTVGYGMTECAPLISYTFWKNFIPGSSGQTLPGYMESKILSSDPENIPGEICVRGQNVMKGYYRNEEATKQVLEPDGWLHTGDMGTRSQDGTLFIKGRYKTMILSASGQNIYPEEIEAKLNNMPYVTESLVVERGKHLVALVYPDYEEMDRDNITTEQLPEVMETVRLALNKRVAPYEKIDRISLRASEFEKTPKRSIKRFLYQD
ncbi:MAG: AMP-binding protein [Muribaculaceae bacterium]|nr:AMP-binding protein [Muribaculaceae bacterium]